MMDAYVSSDDARLFLAAIPDPGTATRIHKLSGVLKRAHQFSGKLIEPERLHVSLFFLGGLPEQDVRAARMAAADVRMEPFEVLFDRTASFRVIAGSPKSTRLETRCPGADINPFLAVAALVAAGLHGVEKGMQLTTAPITGTNVGAEKIARAPRSLAATTEIFKRSATARDWFGDDFVEHFSATREWEWRQWQDAVTDWELKRYFEII